MWVCRLPVHIGPLGSCRFVADSHKNRCSLRADRVVRPYGKPRERIIGASPLHLPQNDRRGDCRVQ